MFDGRPMIFVLALAVMVSNSFCACAKASCCHPTISVDDQGTLSHCGHSCNQHSNPCDRDSNYCNHCHSLIVIDGPVKSVVLQPALIPFMDVAPFFGAATFDCKALSGRLLVAGDTPPPVYRPTLLDLFCSFTV